MEFEKPMLSNLYNLTWNIDKRLFQRIIRKQN